MDGGVQSIRWTPSASAFLGSAILNDTCMYDTLFLTAITIRASAILIRVP